MSQSTKPIPDLGFSTLSDRLKKSVTCSADDTNKPDFRELDLGPRSGSGSGSPISPLRVGPTISSSSSSSGSVSGRIGNGSNGFIPGGRTTNNHSGELSVDSSLRRDLGTHIFSGGSSATSPAVTALPSGNICPSGRLLKTGMMANRSSKPDVLSLGTGNYGHGSIMRGGSGSPSVLKSTVSGGKVETHVPAIGNLTRSTADPEDLKKLGNEEYKKGRFLQALSFYDRAIVLSPANAAYHCNRAAALMCLKRLTEAVNECDEAIKLDSGYVRAHHRLGSLLISLGQVENARRHLYFKDFQPDPNEAQKLQLVEKHINKCTDSRRVRDWANVLKETEAAISSGADACAQLFACKAEALLKLHQLDDADLAFSNAPKLEVCSSQVMFLRMQSEAYISFVRAQIDSSFGRFENAVTSIEKAGQLDPRNIEVAVLVQNIRTLCRCRARGNDLFKLERFTEACSAYGEGLKCDPSNPIMYCNRAACWFKLGQFERSLDDCNQALLIRPNYTKALLRRAATYSKLERWVESVRDYEVLRRELPNDNDMAESLFHAQVALKKSRGEEVYNLKFGGEVELISNLDQFKAAVASTGASVVLFKTSSDLQCKQISLFLDTLCTRYPSINFLKVDIEESPTIANGENVRIVPTIKIYKKGNRMKEMVCPSIQVLESSVRHYSF